LAENNFFNKGKKIICEKIFFARLTKIALVTKKSQIFASLQKSFYLHKIQKKNNNAKKHPCSNKLVRKEGSEEHLQQECK